jgi:hypothetical protein
MNYQIQGLSIHAEVHGTAEPAPVFLHYWGGTSRTWREVKGTTCKCGNLCKRREGV